MRILYIITAMLFVSMNSYAEESYTSKIIRAESAAHPAISHKATILDMDGNVLRKGTNGWTCQPGTMPGDKKPMCNDALWLEMITALKNKAPFTANRIGISYMLQGDVLVSNSNPYATDVNNGDVWVQEGPHLMLIVPKAMLQGLSTDPFNGGPYVMWKDTPYAHIMVPIKATE